MKLVVLLVLTAVAAFAAEDSWAKVRELKSGAELRIYKVNVKKPVLAKFDQADEESLIIISKNEQLSIPKENIERLDCRPAEGGRLVKETRIDRKTARKGAEVTNNTPPGPTTTVTTGLTFSSKPDFETIYRRTPTGK